MKMGKRVRRPEGIYTIKGRQLQVLKRERDLGVDIIKSGTPEDHIQDDIGIIWDASTQYGSVTNEQRRRYL